MIFILYVYIYSVDSYHFIISSFFLCIQHYPPPVSSFKIKNVPGRGRRNRTWSILNFHVYSLNHTSLVIVRGRWGRRETWRGEGETREEGQSNVRTEWVLLLCYVVICLYSVFIDQGLTEYEVPVKVSFCLREFPIDLCFLSGASAANSPPWFCSGRLRYSFWVYNNDMRLCTVQDRI